MNVCVCTDFCETSVTFGMNVGWVFEIDSLDGGSVKIERQVVWLRYEGVSVLFFK